MHLHGARQLIYFKGWRLTSDRVIGAGLVFGVGFFSCGFPPEPPAWIDSALVVGPAPRKPWNLDRRVLGGFPFQLKTIHFHRTFVTLRLFLLYRSRTLHRASQHSPTLRDAWRLLATDNYRQLCRCRHIESRRQLQEEERLRG